VRLRLTLDGIGHEIDTADPDLLAKWIIEIFGRLRQITPATLIEVQASPSWVYDEHDQPVPDWTADSRIICQRMKIKSPRDLPDALGRQLDEAEVLANE